MSDALSRGLPAALQRVLPAVGLALLAGCSVLRPYPGRRSDPPRPIAERPTQARVAELTPELRDVCHLVASRRRMKTLWLHRSSAVGTAALIEGRYLITAAHNVVDYPLHASRLVGLEVKCGTLIRGEDVPDVVFDRAAIRRNVTAPAYAWRVHHQDRQFENDFAFVDLGATLEYRGALTLAAPNIVRPGDPVRIAGYPGDSLSNGDTLFLGTGTIAGVDRDLITYDILAAHGNSGGPVWKTTAGRAEIVGIHVTGATARAVNEALLARWRTWRESRPR